MNPFKKTIVLFILLPVFVFSGCATPSHYQETKYDVAKDQRPPFREWEFPPRIPGTEGQMMARVQVVDISTKQPIAGAIVVGGYLGPSRGGLSCFASESAITDENGYAWLPNDRDERVRDGNYWVGGPQLASAYKRGYQLIYPPFFSRHNYDDKAWYVYERTPPEMLPYTVKRDSDGRAPWERKRLPGSYPDERSALLASKERSTIYLYPSTAKTKEERRKELEQIDNANGCGLNLPLPFRSFESEGVLPIRRATYQERLEIGFKEDDLSYSNGVIKRMEEGILWQRERVTKGESK